MQTTTLTRPPRLAPARIATQLAADLATIPPGPLAGPDYSRRLVALDRIAARLRQDHDAVLSIGDRHHRLEMCGVTADSTTGLHRLFRNWIANATRGVAR